MLGLLKTRSLQTSVLAALLFYVFANPGMYKIIRKIPGLKFVMKGATEITHQGTLVNALLFALIFLLCVYIINSHLIKDHLKFINIVEYMTEHGNGGKGGKPHSWEAGGTSGWRSPRNPVDVTSPQYKAKKKTDVWHDASGHEHERAVQRQPTRGLGGAPTGYKRKGDETTGLLLPSPDSGMPVATPLKHHGESKPAVPSKSTGGRDPTAPADPSEWGHFGKTVTFRHNFPGPTRPFTLLPRPRAWGPEPGGPKPDEGEHDGYEMGGGEGGLAHVLE